MKSKLIGYLCGVVQTGKGPGKQLDRTLDSTDSLSDDGVIASNSLMPVVKDLLKRETHGAKGYVPCPRFSFQKGTEGTNVPASSF